MAYPTKLSEFIDTMFHILSIPTGYWNNFPYNLGYYHGSYYTFDCVNLLKAVLNGWEDYTTVGDYVHDLSRTGDVNEWQFISECRGLSTDFTQMNVCSALYMQGHIGCYMGGEFTRGGLVYNTIECTSGSLAGDGVVASYVDTNGIRYDHKGGTMIGQWSHNGLLTGWLEYDVQFVDPGRDTDPINPGGGNVNPPWWENPDLSEKKKFKWWMYMKPRYRK